MSPYRDAIVRLEAPQPIVRADEVPSPSERLEVIDYSDGSTVVRLRGDLAPLDEGYGKFALAWIACALVLAAITRQPLVAGFAVVWAGLRRLAPALRYATEEMSVGVHGLAWRRGLRRGLVALEGARFTLQPTAIELDRDRRPHFAALQSLSTPELAWLVARLNRAIERAKR